MKASFRLIMAIIAFGTFGFGCEYYNADDVQTVAYSKEREQIQDLQEQIKVLNEEKDAVITAPQGSDDANKAVVTELEKKIENLSRQLNEATIRSDSGTNSEDTSAGTTGGTTTGGTTGEGTTGGTTGEEIVPTVAVGPCHLIPATPPFYRCMSYGNLINDGPAQAFDVSCADAEAHPIECPTPRPTCERLNGTYDGLLVVRCQEGSFEWCGKWHNGEALASCPIGPNDWEKDHPAGSTNEATFTPDATQCQKVSHPQTDPSTYYRCFNNGSFSSYCLDQTTGDSIRCPAIINCDNEHVSSDPSLYLCKEGTTEWCFDTDNYKITSCDQGTTVTTTSAISAEPSVGDLDPNFGTRGLAQLDVSVFSVIPGWRIVEGTASAATVQGDGKIIAVGTVKAETDGGSSGVNLVIARLCPNGSVDNGANCGGSGFGPSRKGVLILDGYNQKIDQFAPNVLHRAAAVALDSGGSILVAGDVSFGALSGPVLVRLKNDGTLDSSFGTLGSGISATVSATSVSVNALQIKPNGSYVIAGRSGKDAIVIAYDTQGKEMPHGANLIGYGVPFNTRTEFETEGEDAFLALASQPTMDFAVGRSGHAGGDFFLTRYVGGIVNFGTGPGYVHTDFGGQEIATHVLAQDGRILVAGTTDSEQGSWCQGWEDAPAGRKVRNVNFAVARYFMDGTPDRSFCNDGKLTLDFGGTDRPVLLTAWDKNHTIIAGTRMPLNSGERPAFVLAKLDELAVPVTRTVKADLKLENVQSSAVHRTETSLTVFLIGDANHHFSVEKRLISALPGKE